MLDSLHRYRPKFLSTSNGLPSYYDPSEFEHTCILTSQQPKENTDALATDDQLIEPSGETKKCTSVPFVAPNTFRNNDVATNLSTIMKQVLSCAHLLCIFLHLFFFSQYCCLTSRVLQIRVQHTEYVSSNQDLDVYDGYHVNEEATICVYFVNGTCNKGSQCLFSHSLKAKRPPCKFFYSPQVYHLHFQSFSQFYMAI